MGRRVALGVDSATHVRARCETPRSAARHNGDVKVRRKKSAEIEVGIAVHPVDSVRMVTLDDPAESLQAARGAFVRIRPPETLAPEETQSWADRVRAIAVAVRVLPARRSATVPASTFTRVNVEHGGTIREEVQALIAESPDLYMDPDQLMIIESILSEAEHAS